MPLSSHARHLLLWFALGLQQVVMPSSVAEAAPKLTKNHFYSHKKKISFKVASALVALRESSPSKEKDLLAEPFTQLQVKLVPKSSVAGLITSPDVVGKPIWFNEKTNAVGILTDEIVFRISKKTALTALKKLNTLKSYRAALFKKNVYLARFISPESAVEAANMLANRSDILFAHPNFVIPKDWRQKKSGSRSKSKSIGDPFYSSQWHLENTGQFGGSLGADIHVSGAWTTTKGVNETLIAILDGGFQTSHPDLDGAFAVNSGEIAGNNIDDDNNGYIDDVLGWNFKTNSADIVAGVFYDHGTAVAGLIGARENNIGVVGVCPQCRIIPVAVSWTVADDAEAFYYAQKRGAQIISNSWGYPVGTPEVDVLVDAIDDVAATGRNGKGIIILFAMNNINQDDCVGSTPDISSLDSVIAVSGSSDLDKKVTHSAWGDCMEFLSPTLDTNRKGITTTDLIGPSGYNSGRRPTELSDTGYTNSFSGTSAATPIAAGVFGLMLAVNANLSRDQALTIVTTTADKIDPQIAEYNQKTGFSERYGYGRINATKAVWAALELKK